MASNAHLPEIAQRAQTASVGSLRNHDRDVEDNID